jgi:CheY-like chemotaxis protein
MAKILLVDDDELVLYALNKVLHKAGHDVLEAQNGEKALDVLKNENPDILITDIVMPEMEGIELIRRLIESHPDLPFIAMSGGSRQIDTSYLSFAKEFGAYATLEKPFDEQELLDLVNEITEK